MIQIKVNGEPREVAPEITLQVFLESLNLPTMERGVAVCVNGEVVRRTEWPQTTIAPADELEIVQATQGG